MWYTLVPLLVLFGAVNAGEEPEPEPPRCNVKLTPDMIPQIKNPMPVFKLCDQVQVPHDYLSGIVKSVAPDVDLKPFGIQGASAAFDKDRLVAFIRPDTGESRIFPSFECLKPGKDLISKANAAGENFLSETSLY